MKKTKFFLPVALLGLACSLIACSGQPSEESKQSQGGDASQTTQQQGTEEKIKVTAAEGKVRLFLGETVQLTASVDGVSWSTSDDKIATVSDGGLVTAVGAGRVTIKAAKEGYQEGSIALTIELVKIGVTAKDNKTTLIIDETVQLTADQQEVKWSSSDETVASVSQAGLVTALKAGQVTIKAEKDGFNAGSIAITITRPAENARFDLTTAAEHYSADGWWSRISSNYGFSQETGGGATPVTQTQSWGQETESDTYIGVFGEGDKETVKFSSDKDAKGEIIVDMGNSDAVTLAEAMKIKLNDKEISLAGIALEAHEGQWGNSLEFGEVSLGEQDIKKGENTLVFEMLSEAAPYLNEVLIYAGDAKITLIDPPEKSQIEVGAVEIEVIEEATVQIQCKEEGAVYVSQDETIASVSPQGVVTGVKVGKTNITIKKEGMYSIRVQVTVNAKPVEGQIIVEAEDAEGVTSDYQSGGFMKMSDNSGMGGSAVHSGGAYVTAWQGGDLSLTMKFEAEANTTMILSIVGSAPANFMGGDSSPFNFAESCTITLNDEAITVAPEVEFPAASGWNSPMSEVVLAEVNVKGGENTLVFTVTGESAPSIDCFKLTEKGK